MSLIFKIPSFECNIHVDKNKISQVIRNLLSNALKFCRKPGIIKVEVDVVPVSTYNEMKHDTHRYSSRLCRTCNFRPTKDAQTILCDESTYYLRLSVTDDGAGISEVTLCTYIYFSEFLSVF